MTLRWSRLLILAFPRFLGKTNWKISPEGLSCIWRRRLSLGIMGKRSITGLVVLFCMCCFVVGCHSMGKIFMQLSRVLKMASITSISNLSSSATPKLWTYWANCSKEIQRNAGQLSVLTAILGFKISISQCELTSQKRCSVAWRGLSAWRDSREQFSCIWPCRYLKVKWRICLKFSERWTQMGMGWYRERSCWRGCLKFLRSLARI